MKLKQIETCIKSMNKLQKELELYAKEQGWITHCFDCEESLSSRGLQEYFHTCRCYCKVCGGF